MMEIEPCNSISLWWRHSRAVSPQEGDSEYWKAKIFYVGTNQIAKKVRVPLLYFRGFVTEVCYAGLYQACVGNFQQFKFQNIRTRITEKILSEIAKLF